ncbi:MAG: hypothetical protein H7841_15515 [Magnetospirillum sp. WYHS-4]
MSITLRPLTRWKRHKKRLKAASPHATAITGAVFAGLASFSGIYYVNDTQYLEIRDTLARNQSELTRMQTGLASVETGIARQKYYEMTTLKSWEMYDPT